MFKQIQKIYRCRPCSRPEGQNYGPTDRIIDEVSEEDCYRNVSPLKTVKKVCRVRIE